MNGQQDPQCGLLHLLTFNMRHSKLG